MSAREYEFGPYRLDADKSVLWRGDQIVSLTPKALALLDALGEGTGHLAVDSPENVEACVEILDELRLTSNEDSFQGFVGLAALGGSDDGLHPGHLIGELLQLDQAWQAPGGDGS